MKSRKLAATIIAFAALATITPTTAWAESYKTDDSDHPLRYAVMPIHAVGKGIEYVFTRPAFALASRPKCRYIFGKTSNPRTDDYWGDPSLYERYSH